MQNIVKHIKMKENIVCETVFRQRISKRLLFIFYVLKKYVMVMEVSCLLKLNIGEGGNTFI